MTLEPCRELDNTVAEKVLGYTIQHGVMESMQHCGADAQWTVWVDTSGENCNPRPLSTDVAAAIGVLDFLQRRNGILYQMGNAHPMTSPYYVQISGGDLWYDHPRGAVRYGSSLAHAICLAALKAVGAI